MILEIWVWRTGSHDLYFSWPDMSRALFIIILDNARIKVFSMFDVLKLKSSSLIYSLACHTLVVVYDASDQFGIVFWVHLSRSAFVLWILSVCMSSACVPNSVCRSFVPHPLQVTCVTRCCAIGLIFVGIWTKIWQTMPVCTLPCWWPHAILLATLLVVVRTHLHWCGMWRSTCPVPQ